MRRMTMFLPTCACATTRPSRSRLWLFSALSIADCRHFSTSLAMRFWLKRSSFFAFSALKPRIDCATRFSFCGLTRSVRSTARASLEACFGGDLGLLISLPLHLLVGAMAEIVPGGRELAELVANHVFAHEHRRELLAVVDLEGEAHELRHDRRTARPRLDLLATAASQGLLGLVDQITVDKRAFPN